MQKSLILAVFGSVVVLCVAAQIFSMERQAKLSQKTGGSLYYPVNAISR